MRNTHTSPRLRLAYRLVVGSLAIAWFAPEPTAAQGTSHDVEVAVTAADSLEQTQRRRRRRPRSAGSSNVGYIDNAVVATQVQLRYDFARGVDRPDRAEFIYAKCGCYREVAALPGPGGDPDAAGPGVPFAGIDPFTTPVIETDLAYHDLTIDGEVALHDRFSVFAELPFRFLRPSALATASGVGDLRAGFKLALMAEETRYFTLQVATYIPTGDSRRGLGTDHLSVEPALLYHGAVSDRLTVEGEVRYWIPIDGATGAGTGFGGDFAGPVLRYGLGAGYDVTPQSSVRFTPVVELVGWTVTGGLATFSTDGTLTGAAFEDASGDTILNLKVGARFGLRQRDALFLGVAQALTRAVWYENTVRAEYRFVY